jgi:hypothetical protein
VAAQSEVLTRQAEQRGATDMPPSLTVPELLAAVRTHAAALAVRLAAAEGLSPDQAERLSSATTPTATRH